MAFSVKGDVVLRHADGTDFASPDARRYAINIPEVTDVSQYSEAILNVLVAGALLTLPANTYGILVNNLDSTNFLTLSVSDCKGNTTTYAVEPSNTALLTCSSGFTSDLSLAADTATVECRLITWSR